MPAAGPEPSVGAIVVADDGQGRVLLVWQTGGPFARWWLVPGGAVERDERIVDAAARELREETGCTLEEPRLVALYEVMSDPAGGFHMLVHMFRGRAAGTPRAEHGSDVRWIRPDDVPLHPVMRRQLADAGLRKDDDVAVGAALAAAGVRMERLL